MCVCELMLFSCYCIINVHTIYMVFFMLLYSSYSYLKTVVVLFAGELKIATCFTSNGNNLTQEHKFFYVTESLIILSHFILNAISGLFPEIFCP